MRIFLDANILFSAARSNGAVRQLLVLLRDGGHALCADDYVVAEARRNLELKAPDSSLEELLAQVNVAPFVPSELPPAVAALLPENDRPVLAAAIRLRCETLVTGDRRHFGTLYGKIVNGTLICSPRLLAEAVLTKLR